MKQKSTQKHFLRPRVRLMLVGTGVLGLSILIYSLFFIGVQTLKTEESVASTDMTFPAGTYIVDMGVTPQTVGNGLKPYGLIYELLTTYKIPVYWSIKAGKVEDGVDFTYNLKDYKGGPFVIHADNLSPAIMTRITYYESQGMVGTYTSIATTIPIYDKILYYPRVLIDNLSGNDSIIVKYFDNAGIPPAGYEFGTPDDANTCYDVWVNPHGDPTWATHQNLYNFVTYHKSNIWSQCHAVSMLEDIVEPVSPFRQLNYLSETGLSCWKLSACGPGGYGVHWKKPTEPFFQHHHDDPVRQYMGSAGEAIAFNGSEKYFIPVATGGWRPTTKRLITTSEGVSPVEGVEMVYGRAYGDSNNGLVMYSGGHSYNETGTSITGQIAAQRAFHNFMLLCGKERQELIADTIESSAMTSMNWYNVSVSVTGGIPPFTYSWSSSIGGTFYFPDSASTSFLAPSVITPTTGSIICTVTDSCSRVMFTSTFITVSPSPLPVTLTEFTARPQGMNKVIVEWATSSEVNNRYFTIERSKDLNEFTIVGNVPTKGNGATGHAYSLTDLKPLNGKSYYRLSQTDLDGKSKYFDPVVVTMNAPVIQEMVQVGPNPFAEKLYATVQTSSGNHIEIMMFDLQGKLVLSQSEAATSESVLINIDDVSKLKSGQYLLKITDGTELNQTVRVIKR